MKRIFFALLWFHFILCLSAQVPYIFNYQGIAREVDGNLISEQEIKLEISLIAGSTTGQLAYQEEHMITTNDFGLFQVRIGSGINTIGSLSDVSWGSESHFVRTRVDLMNGDGYKDLGTSQLYSVPYAIFAANAAMAETGGSDNQELSLLGNMLTIENGNTIDLGPIQSEQIWQLVSNGVAYNGSGISLRDSLDNQKVRISKLGDGQGFFSISGANGNDNVRISNLTGNPNVGFISVSDEGGDTKSAAYVDDSGVGIVFTNGTNGNRNVNVGYLANFPNNGLISVRDQNGDSQAGIYVDADGIGRVFADVVDVPVRLSNQREKQIMYAHLQGPEAAAYMRGTGELINGSGQIVFPAHFQEMISQGSMTVMITPLSQESRGIAVIEKSLEGFRVQELLDGAGNYEFDWEVKAVRKGYENRIVDRVPIESIPTSGTAIKAEK